MVSQKKHLENVIFNFRCSSDWSNLYTYFIYTYIVTLYYLLNILIFRKHKIFSLFTDWCQNLIYVSSLFQTRNYSNFSLNKFKPKFETKPPMVEREANQDESGFLLQIPISSQNNGLLEGSKGRCSPQKPFSYIKPLDNLSK